MKDTTFPRMLAVRQAFPSTPPLDIDRLVSVGLDRILGPKSSGQRIAVAVGSRGITHLQAVVSAVLAALRARGAQPFIVPAMGSHGGATPEGQKELLAEYGITEQHLGVPIRAAMETQSLGRTDNGLEVFFSSEALRADGVVVINRVKPHTDFTGEWGSGIAKMLVVGLGKRNGAAHFHAAASRFGYEAVLRQSVRVTLRTAPILGGVAIIENQRHEIAHLEVLGREEIFDRESVLCAEAKRLMPKLPFDDLDLLIVDRLGKNISGAGMDPNVIGRGVHGYSSLLGGRETTPVIRRLFVRELTPESHGNAIGIGLADATTARLVRGIDSRVTAVNALTALTVQCAKVPITFETDREAIAELLESLALSDPSQAKVVRIADTLSLERVQVSESYADQLQAARHLEILNEPKPMAFDSADNLVAL